MTASRFAAAVLRLPRRASLDGGGAHLHANHQAWVLKNKVRTQGVPCLKEQHVFYLLAYATHLGDRLGRVLAAYDKELRR